MFRGPMQGGMMGAPQGMPGRGSRGDRWITGGGYGPGGMGSQIGRGHPGMRGPQGMPPQWDAFPGGWAGGGPEGMAGPIGSFPNIPPQFQGGPPAGIGGFRQPGFISGGRDDPSRGGSGYWGGGRGMPAGPPIPRRLPMRQYR